MAKPNYAFEKRQRERAKKEKKAEKAAQRKTTGDRPDDPQADQPGGQAVERPVEDSDAPTPAASERTGTGTEAAQPAR